ncbi:MAG: hypothetical protein QM726_14250 [Chitinophagaceae bacterium]
MKNTFGNRSLLVVMLLSFVFSLSSCYESRYYHRYNHHTRGWYDHRHMPPPAGVNFEVDIDARHRH